MRLAVVAFLAATLLAGCAGDGPATSRLAGQLDRGLTPSEQDEVRRVAGKGFTVESTDMACAPGVDPYDCNATWLRVDGLTARACESAASRLAARTYWRTAPACDVPAG